MKPSSTRSAPVAVQAPWPLLTKITPSAESGNCSTDGGEETRLPSAINVMSAWFSESLSSEESMMRQDPIAGCCCCAMSYLQSAARAAGFEGRKRLLWITPPNGLFLRGSDDRR